MPAPHALCSKMLAERTASRNVLVLFYFIYLLTEGAIANDQPKTPRNRLRSIHSGKRATESFASIMIWSARLE